MTVFLGARYPTPDKLLKEKTKKKNPHLPGYPPNLNSGHLNDDAQMLLYEGNTPWLKAWMKLQEQ